MSKFSNINPNNLFYLPSLDVRTSNAANRQANTVGSRNRGGSWNPSKNLSLSLSPVPTPRIVLDVYLWRQSLILAEDPIIPQRWLMQNCYIDTVIDPHIKACLEYREGLTLMSKFSICDDIGDENTKWQKYFEGTWFKTWCKYTLEAKWYGYSLISMGDLVDGFYKDIIIIPRNFISPDRLNVVAVPNALIGEDFINGEAPNGQLWSDSHIWINTPDQHGLAACGYGLLYTLTLLAIGLRNNLSFNQQFVEMFAMPYRLLKTDKQDKDSLNNFEASLSMMGSLGYLITGKDDELEFLNEGGSGRGYLAYGDLEMRIEKKISKILLGHSDAMDSAGKTPQNKGNSSTGMGSSPQSQALANIQAQDAAFMMEQINGKLIPFLRRNGVMIPNNLHFEYTDDNEEKEEEKYRNEQNVLIGQTIQALAMGNINVIPTPELMEQMNLKLEVKPEPTPSQPGKPMNPNNIINVKSNSPEFTRFKERLDDKKKPTTVSQEEWDSYKTDREYKKLTEGFDDEEYGLTKEEYKEYAENVQEHLDTDTPLREDDGDVNLHINCQCSIENGVWQFGENPCEDCLDAAADYEESKGDVENAADILNSHKDYIKKKNGIMVKGSK